MDVASGVAAVVALICLLGVAFGPGLLFGWSLGVGVASAVAAMILIGADPRFPGQYLSMAVAQQIALPAIVVALFVVAALRLLVVWLWRRYAAK